MIGLELTNATRAVNSNAHLIGSKLTNARSAVNSNAHLIGSLLCRVEILIQPLFHSICSNQLLTRIQVNLRNHKCRSWAYCHEKNILFQL